MLLQVLETIPEEEDEEQGEKIEISSLIQRTHLAKEIEEERRKISTMTPLSPLRDTI